MITLFALSLGAFVGQALADTHYLFNGVFSGSEIYTLVFDDSTYNLSIANTSTIETDSSKWVAIDHDRNVLYIAQGSGYGSYSIEDDLTLLALSNITISEDCQNTNYVLGSTVEPFAVFGAPYSDGCDGQAMSVDDSGNLQTLTANITYGSSSAVHGLAMSPAGDFIYSADDNGDAVWVHSFNSTTGAVEEVQKLSAASGANPRHLAVHPNGAYVYVIYEQLNELAVYTRNNSTGELTFTNTTYSLLPSGYTNTSSYWSDEVAFTVNQDNAQSPTYLLASSRSRTTTDPGFVAGFALNNSTGAIEEELFLLPTTGSGGAANSISPALFSEDYFTITDSSDNFVEIWKLEETTSTRKRTTSVTASVVAHLDMDVGPANVVWYS